MSLNRGYTQYKVIAGLGETVYSDKIVSVLNGSFTMLHTIKATLQKRYGSLAWVKFVRLDSESE